MLKILPVILLAVFYFDCNSSRNLTSNSPTTGSNNETNGVKNPSSQTQEIPKDLLITLERTACYGTCPVYKLSIKADGTVEFEGIKNTQTQGKAEGKIDENKIKELIKEFENAGYSNLNDKYDSKTCPLAATDNSTVITSLQMDGKNKTVSHYLGCVEDNQQRTPYPPKLRELENKIDELAETKRWIGTQK